MSKTKAWEMFDDARKTLKIGQKLKVYAYVTPGYSIKTRSILRVPLEPPEEVFYTGWTLRKEGEICKAISKFSIEWIYFVACTKRAPRSKERYSFFKDVEVQM